jgi:hypothetical protein
VSEQLQLPGHCWRCGGTGGLPHTAVIAVGRPQDREYECVRWWVPCPTCQPAPTVRDEWMAAVQLGWPRDS